MANYVIIISRIHSLECIVEEKIFKGNGRKGKVDRGREALKFFFPYFLALHVINN